MRNTIRGRLAIAALATLLGTIPMSGGASAASAATDLAFPIWNNGGTAYSTSHGLDCSYSTNNTYYPGCKLSVSTVTSGANCVREVISGPAATPVPLVSGPTPCTVVVTGGVKTSSGPGGCLLYADQSLTVSFSSGVMSVFNATFPASAIFVPKSQNTTTDAIKSFHVHITGGGLSQSQTTQAGQIDAPFEVTFGTPLPKSCPNRDVLNSNSSKGPLNRPASSSPDASKVVVSA